MINLGIDEAGRGPLIGPMVIAGVSFRDSDKIILKRIGVKDSKLLSPSSRTRLFEEILKICLSYIIFKIKPKEIDEAIESGVKITGLEAKYIAKIIDSIECDVVYIDSPTNNPEKFKNLIEKLIKSKPKIVCETKADYKYLEVSAASIIAKVVRDKEIEELHKKYGYFGSGYPGDPITIEFINKHNEILNSDDVRKSWITVKKFKNKKLF